MAHGTSSEHVDSEHLRKRLRLVARAFLGNWVELAELLARVRREELWAQWKYESFDAYFTDELKLSRKAVRVLTDGLEVLSKHAPEVLAGPAETRVVPSLEVVEAVARAERSGRLSEEKIEELSEVIWKEDKPAAYKLEALEKAFTEPVQPAPKPGFLLKRLAATAKKLSDEVATLDDLPKSLRDHASALAKGLAEQAGKWDERASA